MLESIYIYNALCYFVTVCLSPRGPVFLTYTGGLHTFLHKWEGDSREDKHFLLEAAVVLSTENIDVNK